MESEIQSEEKKASELYEKMIQQVRPLLKKRDFYRLRKAFLFSFNAHEGMRRKSGELYIYHPLSVAQICVEEIGLGTTSIIVALVHDVVEDTPVKLSDIEEQFGEKVAQITDGLTKIEEVFAHGQSAQAENFRKMILTLTEDVRVILIKLADRLHNMRTLDSMPRNKQVKIASETIYFYAPMAHRLGLHAIKTEMEDLYLRFTNKSVYDEIAHKIGQAKVLRTKFTNQFIFPIKKDLDILKVDYGVKSRPKSIYSVWKKMCTQNIPFENVYDLFAVRIIIDPTTTKDEKTCCWQAYSIVTDHYAPNPDRLRDWISVPKVNGYESLHTTVMAKNGQWVEVQIRTKRMNEIAEKGYAAHWKYKDNVNAQESNLEKWLLYVRESLERKDLSALEFVNDFKANLFHHEIVVFTPMGELKMMPKDSTALDFAFEIHSAVGMRCIGAKVNRRLVPISYVLQNGDQVEILTSARQKPKMDWLSFVITSKAKIKIRGSLKEARKIVAEKGKEILVKKIKKINNDLNGFFAEKMRIYFNLSSSLDLYYKVGMGEISIRDLRRAEKADASLAILSKKKQLYHPLSIKKDTHVEAILIGDDMEKVSYRLAKCCAPIPGDDIFGFVTVSEEVKIHRIDCNNATELLANHDHRVMKAKWASVHIKSFLTMMKIIGIDRVGLISNISKVISMDLKVNMRSLTFNTDDGIFTGDIALYVNDKKHFEDLMSKIQKIEGVETVNRIDNENDAPS